MKPVTCFSSQFMTWLLKWRNPQGSELNWAQTESEAQREAQRAEPSWTRLGKRLVVTEGLGCIAIASIVETVVYSIFALVSFSFSDLERRPFVFFAKLVQSSSFTIFWALHTVFLNIDFVNVPTEEPFARFLAYRTFPEIMFYRLEDIEYIDYWRNFNFGMIVNLVSNNNRRNINFPPHPDQRDFSSEQIGQVTDFIIQDMLPSFSPNTLNFLRPFDQPGLTRFILTKAVYMYAAGSKRTNPIPNFFKLETRNLITTFRSKQIDETVRNRLEVLTQNYFRSVRLEGEGEDVRSAFHELLEIGSQERRGLLCAKICWQKATLVLEGASFLLQDVVPGLNPDDLNLFRETNIDVIPFILVKAVYIYAAGSKRTDPIPGFFKSETRNLITTFRSKQINETVQGRLQYFTQNRGQFNGDKADEIANVRSMFNELQQIASRELQGSLFLMKCWELATKRLAPHE